MNNDGPNWAKLVVEGRARDIGIPWSEEELNAIYKLKIPYQFVRDGALTVEDYEKAQKKVQKIEKETGEKPLDHMTKEELQAKASSMGLKFTKAATTGALIKLITKAQK